jgi:hypothetical protein
MAHGFSLARRERLQDFRPCRVIFHRFGIMRRIREDLSALGNHGDACAARRGPGGPCTQIGGIARARRPRFGKIRQRCEGIGRGPDIVAAEDMRGVKIQGEENTKQQGEVTQPQFPEKPSSHGFRRDIRPRGSSSCTRDAADRLRSFPAAGARRRPRCAASRNARCPTRHRAIDRA